MLGRLRVTSCNALIKLLAPNADIRAQVEDTEIEANISAWITELEAAVQ